MRGKRASRSGCALERGSCNRCESPPAVTSAAALMQTCFMADRRSDRYCIIGAGASGLAVAKNFVERGIPFDCLEREQDIGGLWNFATQSGIVYETTHLVSSISSTGYDDLPMLDEDYPEYPSHERVLGYFRDYVAHVRARAAHRARQDAWNALCRARDTLWEVTRRGRGAAAHLSRRGDRERPSRRAAHAELSRHLRRRDHALARLQEPEAGARQARAGGGLRQLGGRHRVRCRARRLAGVPEHPPRLLVRAEVHAGLSDRRRRLLCRDGAAAAPGEALAVPGAACGCCRVRRRATACPIPTTPSTRRIRP